MYKVLLIISISYYILLVSCTNETQTYLEIENPTVLKKGNWISDTDSLSGVSFRTGMLAFYVNRTATRDSIYRFQLIDSIIQIGSKTKKIGTYLKKMNDRDTVYIEVLEVTDSTITLKDTNSTQRYRFQ